MGRGAVAANNFLSAGDCGFLSYRVGEMACGRQVMLPAATGMPCAADFASLCWGGVFDRCSCRCPAAWWSGATVRGMLCGTTRAPSNRIKRAVRMLFQTISIYFSLARGPPERWVLRRNYCRIVGNTARAHSNRNERETRFCFAAIFTRPFFAGHH